MMCLQNVTSISICEVRLGSGKSFIVHIVLAEGIFKTCCILGRETNLILYFSPSKFVTKRACPLNQCIVSHTTTMKVVTGGEWGHFKMKSCMVYFLI